MNDFHAQPDDITSHGKAISDIAQEITDGTRKGRSLTMTHPGMAVTSAFEAFRDSWLGEGERIGLDLDDTGNGTVDSSANHTTNEDLITRGYESVNPR